MLSLPEQNRRGLRRDQASRRMVALYDYDPRESSPNVDVEVLPSIKKRNVNHSLLEFVLLEWFRRHIYCVSKIK